MIRLFSATVLCLIASFSWAQEKVIRVNDNGTDPNAAYAIKMLQLAIDHIDTKYKIEVIKDNFSQTRVNEEVRTNGALDMVWASSEATIESELHPIRICLYKGLLGYRIFIINKNNQYKFDQVNSLDDLRKLTVGQGKTWADTKILQANGFNVITITKYPNLFYMVDGGRFDGFPRGVHEPFGELAQRPELKDLTVEKNLMISYRMPFYLFTSHENKKLATEINLGLERAIADGSFDDVFYNDPNVKDVLAKANMKQRKVFYIDNPLLSKETPLDRKELWFDPKSAP
jgi:hypothetical protein